MQVSAHVHFFRGDDNALSFRVLKWIKPDGWKTDEELQIKATDFSDEDLKRTMTYSR